MKLVIAYKNGTTDEYDETDLDCSKLTIRGHAENLIRYWMDGREGNDSVYKIDNYNAIIIDQIICVRVMT